MKQWFLQKLGRGAQNLLHPASALHFNTFKQHYEWSHACNNAIS